MPTDDGRREFPVDIDLPELNVREFFEYIYGSKHWVILSTIVCLLVSSFVYYISEPIYRADALIQIETGDSGSLGVGGSLGELLGGDASPLNAELEILKSRSVLGDVVDKQSLDIIVKPRCLPVLGPAICRGSYEVPRTPPSLFEQYAWGGQSADVTRFDIAERFKGRAFTLKRTSAGYSLLAPENLNPICGGKIGVVASCDYQGEPIELFVKDLVAVPGTEFTLRKVHRRTAIAGLAASTQASEKGKQSGIVLLQMSGTDPNYVVDTLTHLVRSYQRQNVERKSEEAESTLEFLNDQLPIVRKALGSAEDALNAYRLRQGSADLTKETDLVLQQIVELERKSLELEQQKTSLLERFTEDHPTVEIVSAKLRQVQEVYADLKRRIERLPETQQDLLRFSRDVQVNQSLYTSLLNSVQELQIIKAGTIGNIRIIDEPVLPLEPSEPQLGSFLLGGIFLGVLVGLLGLSGRYMFASEGVGPLQLESKLKLQALAMVPFSPLQKKIEKSNVKQKDLSMNKVLAFTEPQSLAIEALRSLRTSIHFSNLESSESRRIMITGPSPGLGKSFVSINLAAVFTASGAKVVLIDADLRRGHVHKSFSVNNEFGLSQLLSGERSLDEVLFRAGNSELWVIPRGPVPSAPSEMLMAPRFANMLDSLSENFDVIIVDTPPILSVTDAAIVGRHMNYNLMVLKEFDHSLEEVRDSVSRLESAGVSMNGAVFNQIGATSNPRGSYGQSSYYYSYAAGKYEYTTSDQV